MSSPQRVSREQLSYVSGCLATPERFLGGRSRRLVDGLDLLRAVAEIDSSGHDVGLGGGDDMRPSDRAPHRCIQSKGTNISLADADQTAERPVQRLFRLQADTGGEVRKFLLDGLHLLRIRDDI